MIALDCYSVMYGYVLKLVLQETKRTFRDKSMKVLPEFKVMPHKANYIFSLVFIRLVTSFLSLQREIRNI